MSEKIEFLKFNYQTINVYGRYFALLFLSVFYIGYRRKKEHSALFWYAFLSLVITFNPFFADWIAKAFPDFLFYWKIMAITPAGILIAVTLADLAADYYDGREKDKKGCLQAGTFLIACMILIFISGELTFLNHENLEIKRSDNKEKIDKPVLEILQLLDQEEADDILLWAPYEVLQYARAYNGNIKLVYGRDMWYFDVKGINLRTYDDYNETLQQEYIATWNQAEEMDLILNAARKHNCNYLVLKKNEGNTESAELYSYQLIGQTSRYNLYHSKEE